jgi:hypothetical protein
MYSQWVTANPASDSTSVDGLRTYPPFPSTFHLPLNAFHHHCTSTVSEGSSVVGDKRYAIRATFLSPFSCRVITQPALIFSKLPRELWGLLLVLLSGYVNCAEKTGKSPIKNGDPLERPRTIGWTHRKCMTIRIVVVGPHNCSLLYHVFLR